jgi:hypothetical protein
MTHWWVTEALGLELASARLTILLILRRKPGRKCRTDHPESRLRSQLLTHLLLQLLRKVPGEVLFPPIQQVGLTRILHCAGFIFLISTMTPWDIFPDSSVKGPEPSDDIPNGEDNPSSSGTKSSPHVSKALTSHNASPRTTILGPCPMENPWNFETAESPKTTPPNNPSDGIGSTGEDPIGGDSTQPEPRSLPR